jgi:hypothetical protein
VGGGVVTRIVQEIVSRSIAAEDAVREVVEFLRPHAPYYADLVEKEFLAEEPAPLDEVLEDAERGRTR